MKHAKGRITDVHIAYIGGGSRGWAWSLMADLAMEEQLSGTIRLYDIDEEAAHHNEIIGNNLSKREDVVGKWNYVTVSTIKEALTGADFVIISILPGTFDEMESDVHLPERAGIYQPVGDSTGPGGLIRSLRTIPMFIEFAQAVRDYCPDAWVINYTNPMSVCVKTLYYAFPEIKAFGCCHEVLGVRKWLLTAVYKEATGEEIKDWEKIEADVFGINHFTWISSASYKGIDLFPLIDQYMENNFKNGIETKAENWVAHSEYFDAGNQVILDLYKRFGCLGGAGDRHLSEFMPSSEYLKNPEKVRDLGFNLTPVSWRKEDLKERLAKSERLLKGEEELELKPSGEEGVALIKALLGLGRMISNVNVPNTDGQIANLPADAVVETNAVFEKNQIRPITTGNIPQNIKELIIPHIENHGRILRAAVLCDKELVVEAFLHDPQIKGKNLREEEVRSLVDDMIRNTLTYLPDAWKKEV